MRLVCTMLCIQIRKLKNRFFIFKNMNKLKSTLNITKHTHNIYCLKTFFFVCYFEYIFMSFFLNIIVYYKSLWDNNWCEKGYDWADFYPNEILCVGWGITNMPNYYLFYVKCYFKVICTYNTFQVIHKLRRKYNVFMSMT